MIDRGALLTMIALAVAVTTASRFVRPSTLGKERVLDAATPPLLAGVFGARIVSMVLDDPSASPVLPTC